MNTPVEQEVVVPAGTYRLQLHKEFGFRAAARIVDYLAALGISHVYCSPYLQAAAGSTHGYDVVDHGRVNCELGGEAGHREWIAALARHRLGQVLDIVPNHMAIGAGNVWWRDVLEHGPSSIYASYFDVEWDPPEARLRNLVLLPVLADHYGRVLERGEIQLVCEDARFNVACGDDRYPLNPASLGPILATAAEQASSRELAFLADALRALPRATATDRRSVERRQRDSAVIGERLAQVFEEQPKVAEAVHAVLAAINESPDALHEVLEAQNFRLAWWKSAARDLGYRRFFDVNRLIGLRAEDENVFHGTHWLILDWVRRGLVDGLRIDHPDGLRNPLQYLQRLRAAAPHAWIVVEKILERDESLPETWPVQGTTGYDFLNRVLGLLIDSRAEGRFTTIYQAFTGEAADFHTFAREKKLLVERTILGSELNGLADLFLSICEANRRYRDFSRHEVTEALRELMASFSVYRTYVDPERSEVSENDRAQIRRALIEARTARPDLDPGLFEFIGSVLLLTQRGGLEHEFVWRFQQATGSVMAKGVEDTAFYSYARFIALNEVGGDPGWFGRPVESFHRANAWTAEHAPHTMLTTATHDTKRGEDVRARLAVLSEIPDEWERAVGRWRELTARFRRGDYPDPTTEYFFYQTLVGAWPIDVTRAWAYMEKAIREAKTFTSWTAPSAAYERAVQFYVTAVLADESFVTDIEQFVRRILTAGRVNSLAQTLLKLTSPGVPDLYQGTELWSLDLVDPDNRRPVDYEPRQRLLAALDCLTPEDILARSDEGMPKLWVIRQALAARAAHPSAVGAEGAYRAVAWTGSRADHVVSFARGAERDELLVAVPRLTLQLGGDWGDTSVELPEGRWHNVLTDESWTGRVDAAQLFARFPVALVERRD